MIHRMVHVGFSSLKISQRQPPQLLLQRHPEVQPPKDGTSLTYPSWDGGWHGIPQPWWHGPPPRPSEHGLQHTPVGQNGGHPRTGVGGFSSAPFGLSAGGLGFFSSTSIFLMVSPPSLRSCFLIFSGELDTTLIITAFSFSKKVQSSISLVHKSQRQIQNQQLSSSSFQHCPQPQNYIYKTLTRNFIEQFLDLLVTAFTPQINVLQHHYRSLQYYQSKNQKSLQELIIQCQQRRENRR